MHGRFLTSVINIPKKKKSSAVNLHAQLVVFTFLSICASVIYVRTYGSQSPHSNKKQLTFFVCTVLLPLYVTSLKDEADSGHALQNWSFFQIATHRIESEILTYRSQVGKYRIEEKTEIALHKATETFVTNIKIDIFGSIKTHLKEDGMLIPPDFWEFDAEAHFPSQKNSKSDNTHLTASSEIDCRDEEVPTDLKCENEEYDVNYNPPASTFDKYRAMTADDYIEHRMQTAMHAKAMVIQDLVSHNTNYNIAIKAVTIGSAALAALSLQWAVPIILGVTAALGSGQDYNKYPQRIESGNTMVMKLNTLKLWWMGLSMYQKQLPQNKDHLIITGEKIILTDVESFFAGHSESSESSGQN